MTRGPPPQPTNLRLLRGNPSKRPLPQNKPQPTIPPEVPDPPNLITGIAADEWWRIAPELHRMGLLSMADIPALAAYCSLYEHWYQATHALKRMANKNPALYAIMIKSRTGDPMTNPLFYAAHKAANDLLRYASEFGFTPAARARIAAGIDQSLGKSAFDGLLA